MREQKHLSQLERKRLSNWLLLFKPKPKLTISQWADEYRYVARGTSPEPGRWQTKRTPYLREILDTFNTSVGTVVVMASSQVGKTEIGINLAGFYISEDPSPIMYLLPTDGLAEEFSKTRIQKTIDDTPELKKLFSNNSRDSDNTISLKTFPGGYITLHGANTPTKLSSKPIRILIADEVDRFQDSLTREGDPLKLAIQRTTNFFNRKLLVISTPTVRETSRIVEWFEKSDKRFYHVPCPDCEHEFVLNWGLVHWEKDSNNELIDESVHVKCPACSYEIKDKHKPEMLANGRWIQTEIKKTMPGFHISSLYSPWVKFKELATEFIEASRTKDKTKLREFLNLKLGEPFEEQDKAIELEKVTARREFYDCDLPEGVLYLTAGVDVQDDRLAIHFIGWGSEEESWVLEYFELIGDPAILKTWELLDEQLQKTFTFANGRKLTISISCIDSGGHFTDEVYEYVKSREHMRILAIKGRGGEGVPIVGNFTRTNKFKIALFNLGVDTAKDLVYHRLNNEFAGAGYIHFPREEKKGCDLNYFQMLLSEVKLLKFEKGTKRFIWKKVFRRNEALDTYIYALAALRIGNPDFEKLQKKISEMPTDDVIHYRMLTEPNERRIVSSVNIYDSFN